MSPKSKVCALLLSALVLLTEANNTPKCYTCEGINCQRSSRTKDQIECSNDLDICVTIFDKLTVAARGCFTDIPEALRRKCETADASECLKCPGDLCNNQGRASCIVCDTKNNANCNTDFNKITPSQCPLPVATNSYCFIRDDQKGNIQRGCVTDLRKQMECMKDATCSMWMPEPSMDRHTEIVQRDNDSIGKSGALGLSVSLAAFVTSIVIFLSK